MSIPITIDGKVYKNTYALVKELNLQVKPNVLYNHYTKKKHSYTTEELNLIVESLSKKKRERVEIDEIDNPGLNLGDLLYNAINTPTNFRIIEDFLTSLPPFGLSKESFIKYFTINYPKIQTDLPLGVDLPFLLEILDFYLVGKVHPNLNKTRKERKKTLIRGKSLREYAIQYGLRYNSVWDAYAKIKGSIIKEEDFFRLLEEKSARLLRKKKKLEKKAVLNNNQLKE